jgi:hypothetical protein
MVTKFIRFVVGSGISLIFAGCYTQFAVVDKAVPETIKTVVDSTGDTVKVIERTDTVLQKDNQVCVWERDLMGYPRLRCYRSFYPQDWFAYNNTPWWYRNDPFWGDFDRCPRYYYYDLDCGCCRYSTNRYDYFDRSHHYGRDYDRGFSGHGGNSGGGGGGGGASGPSGNSSHDKDTRTTAKKVVEPSPSQSPVGVPKISTVEPASAAPQTQPEGNEPQNNDNVEPVKKRDLRSLRGR